jgi:hypothetical protein
MIAGCTQGTLQAEELSARASLLLKLAFRLGPIIFRLSITTGPPRCHLKGNDGIYFNWMPFEKRLNLSPFFGNRMLRARRL